MREDRGLIKRDTLTQFCEAYAAAVADIERGFDLFDAAAKRLEPIIQYGHAVKGWHTYDGTYFHERRDSLSSLKREAWSEIAKRSGVRDTMAPKRRQEFDNQLDRGELPDITVDNVIQFLDNFAGSLQDIAAEAVKAAADILRPNNMRYVTNGDGWALEEKAITEWQVSWCKFTHRFGINYSREANIAAIDNAFHLLDGRGPARQKDDGTDDTRLRTAIVLAMDNKIDHAETPYFRVKWFKNGNMHWTMKRMDLVAKLNQIAATHNQLRRPEAA